jgi:hypothetical protein
LLRERKSEASGQQFFSIVAACVAQHSLRCERLLFFLLPPFV